MSICFMGIFAQFAERERTQNIQELLASIQKQIRGLQNAKQNIK